MKCVVQDQQRDPREAGMHNCCWPKTELQSLQQASGIALVFKFYVNKIVVIVQRALSAYLLFSTSKTLGMAANSKQSIKPTLTPCV